MDIHIYLFINLFICSYLFKYVELALKIKSIIFVRDSYEGIIYEGTNERT